MVPVRSWPSGLVIADASVWINLIAGERATEIIQVFKKRPQIPRIALDELERGREKGRETAGSVAELISIGLVEVADLPSDVEETYLSLVAGPIGQTLDDGEAATLALAFHGGGIAAIDERKAMKIARDRFSSLQIMTTTELLLSDEVRALFSDATLGDVLYGALKYARMRVPDHLVEVVCAFIGPERAAHCISLPSRARQGARDGAQFC